MLSEILSRSTGMPVTEVRDEPRVEPNHIYVIPPNRDMVISHGALKLLPREGGGQRRPIDGFLRSLAEDQGYKSIGVILSGSATDGTVGLQAIKAEGGITFAQDSTAHYDGMPRSAIAAGCVDFVLPPQDIAKELARICATPMSPTLSIRPDEPDTEPHLFKVLQVLHNATGVDFSSYKSNTLYRRVTRRMLLHQMEGIKEYTQLLLKEPREVEALFQDILISVTNFFRNPDAFEVLKAQIFTRLMKDRSRHEPVRIWVLGCSTGEEAYSIAMAFTEFTEAAGSQVPVQIFATDLNDNGIEKARAGLYSKTIAQDVGPERLRRFFVEVDGSYRISKPIRDMCVFARHNVLVDPPFSRIDLITCRNLLIYLEPVLQQKVVAVFHYALKPAGFLWLGGSETIGSYRELFEVEDARYKIYAKKPGPSRLPAALVPEGVSHGQSAGLQKQAGLRDVLGLTANDIHKEVDRILIGKYVPPGVLINSDLDILQFRGDTSPFLAPAQGRPA